MKILNNAGNLLLELNSNTNEEILIKEIENENIAKIVLNKLIYGYSDKSPNEYIITQTYNNMTRRFRNGMPLGCIYNIIGDFIKNYSCEIEELRCLTKLIYNNLYRSRVYLDNLKPNILSYEIIDENYVKVIITDTMSLNINITGTPNVIDLIMNEQFIIK